MNNQFYYRRPIQQNNDRFVGGFAVPFLLGGLTGGLLAPAFNRPYPYYQPYPVYRPYPVYQYPTYNQYYYY